MNEQSFKENIAMLTKYFRFELSPDYVALYWNMLKHLDDDQFKMAVTGIIKTFIPTSTVPFPLVTHFLRACGNAGENQVIAGIAKLKKAIGRVGQYQSVDFKDPALHYTVNVFGGWPAICTWTDEEWDVNEKRLSEVYRVALETDRGDSEHLPGISEKDNGVYRIYSISQVGKVIDYKNISPMLPFKQPVNVFIENKAG